MQSAWPFASASDWRWPDLCYCPGLNPLRPLPQPPPPSAYTEPYSAEGYFTGVRSTITIQRSPSIVYDSLSKDLHHVFTPITVRR